MYAFNSAAIFSPGHPYIESTTVLSDDKLCYIFKKFCSRYKSLLDKFGVHIKYHVKKGIALPINCINTLGRFITVR